jgi:hypothetical protein
LIRVALRDGTFQDFENAVTADLQGRELVLRDVRGIVVARFPAERVIIHGPPELIPNESDDSESGRETG